MYIRSIYSYILIVSSKDVKPRKSVRLCFKAEIGFINEKVPTFFRRKPIYVCFLAETSDGRLIDFRRIRCSLTKSVFTKARILSTVAN